MNYKFHEFSTLIVAPGLGPSLDQGIALDLSVGLGLLRPGFGLDLDLGLRLRLGFSLSFCLV